MTTKNKPVEKKNAVWTFNGNTNVCSVTFPDGTRANYDLSSVVVGLNDQQKLIYMYGFKQLVASNAAAEKSAKDKIASFDADYTDIIAGNVIMFGEGKIGFNGRTRANAKPSYETILLEKLDTLTIENCQTVINMAELGMGYKLSESLLGKIKERLEKLQAS